MTATLESLEKAFPLIDWKAFKFETAGDVYKKLTPQRILKSGNRTIVFWGDGTKTIVKRGADEADNEYNAFVSALGIKLYGSNSALRRIVSRTERQIPKKVAPNEEYSAEIDAWLDSIEKRGKSNAV